MNDLVIDGAKKQILNSQEEFVSIKAFFDEPTFTVSYVVHDVKTKKGVIIDSVLDYEQSSGRTAQAFAKKIVAHVEEQGLDIEWLLETHAHADHVSAAPYLQESLGGKIAIGEHISTVQEVFGKVFNAGTEFQRDGSDFNHLFADGDTFKLGELDVTVLHVPGHTPACLAYVIGDSIFCGDTMFMPDNGTARADFPGGDARQLYRSMRRILSLPDTTRMFLCHDYMAPDRQEYKWETTVGAQRRDNIHVHDGVTEDQFVAMRNKRDSSLALPKLILPSVQINIRAGHLPPAEDNGVRYLKIPLDTL